MKWSLPITAASLLCATALAAAQDYRHATIVAQRFTISVGASVPRQVSLKPLPGEIAGALQSYNGDQYVLVGDQLVVVEPQDRRIVAILPAQG